MPNTRRRRISGVGFRIYTYLSLLLILGPAAWLLISVVAPAAPHSKWSVLPQPLKGQTGGLRDQILGTLIMMAGVLVMAGTVGVLAGIHLSELAKTRKSGRGGGGGPRPASA